MSRQPDAALFTERYRIAIRGAVQGVGFRPFVYRLATELGLTGWVCNAPEGVFVEAEGDAGRLREFLRRLAADRPPRAVIQSLEHSVLDPEGYTGFDIRASAGGGAPATLVLPDIATCPECRREIFDPADRRYRYPFTNCTNCGPRFSILESLPYDRPMTTMKGFVMCPDCRREYENPLDRRFHAQPNACPRCGPHLELWDAAGNVRARHDDALRSAEAHIRSGRIVALKGIGGFQLIADARSEAAVRRLRDRKRREEKPFALMCPSLAWAAEHCEISPAEERLLAAPEAPIVLLRRRRPAGVAPAVAPGNPDLGVMLPYSPLHHLLMGDLGFPVVATSGNATDEPICTDEERALARLTGIADVFLVHNRPISAHADDSVVRIVLGREQVLRRARGYAPLPLAVGAPPGMVAVGAQLKNAVAVAAGGQVFVSQHIGDLETAEAYDAFRQALGHLAAMYGARPPRRAVCDMHPDYLSARYARLLECPVEEVQHHYAHVASCMAENGLAGRALGVAWDGTGYGPDGTVWGGEVLVVEGGSYSRAGTFRQFRLPGGESAVREPRRSAAGLLFELFGPGAMTHEALAGRFSRTEAGVISRMLAGRVNAPVTSSAGRLFDAVASLLGVRDRTSFEGQAAAGLEYLASGARTDAAYPIRITGGRLQAPWVFDWGPMVREILLQRSGGVSPAVIAAKFHNTLAEVIVSFAERAGEEKVVLSGGCFQNRYLTERAVTGLRAAGFRPYWHQRVPPNDGGIALGQIAAAAWRGQGAGQAAEYEQETADVPRNTR